MTGQYSTDTVDAESTSACACCGRSVYEGTGWLLRGDDEVACYLYRWAEGHEVAFSLAVAGTKDGYMRPGFVAVSCRQKGGDMSFSVAEAADSPWQDSESFGPVLSRQEALDSNGLYPDLWHLVDTIVALEPRLAQRISALHGAKPIIQAHAYGAA